MKFDECDLFGATSSVNSPVWVMDGTDASTQNGYGTRVGSALQGGRNQLAQQMKQL
ncbi:MAG: hypothetical protein H7293_04060 [Candidatus Saccharibacteria bacterium]|nr:hypothetical protein [Rhodoferax sp.]